MKNGLDLHGNEARLALDIVELIHIIGQLELNRLSTTIP